MKIQEIREIIKLVDNSSINEFSYEFEGVKVKIKKDASNAGVQAPAQPQAAAETVQAAPAPKQAEPQAAAQSEQPSETEADSNGAADQDLHKILSPMVGTFYQSPSPEEDAYVAVGTKVSADQVVCIVEAMKLFNEIEAEVDGEIAEILVKDGQLVEYGQPLFLVKSN
ncbi:acetyl-CoA carboxylase biotin carboxyl carrier protein [Planococcus sp. ISL-109]|uniref:acetyl-CoA carboxylase biotin carboxyl carrier protein n=1 Tax=Planococcus sp. ISL-109 TaxID=2819166 RepID=UPI001BEBD024|nr:acetyl-CoA carboxylase biotin carboxyl carrier protein [Planococcus sp. ISL-109]MBT2582283.1 acetyl-CoA carboxylase biotin carboxyl carrier protein [Planococcus sp. ISL-109]